MTLDGFSPDVLNTAAGMLRFSPPPLPQGIHGKEDWNKYWGDVGDVPHPPEKMLKALNGPCPISNRKNKVNGPKMMDTHIVVWIPPAINDEALTINLIERVAKSHKFGNNKIGKIGYSYIDEKNSNIGSRHATMLIGHWVAMYKRPILAGIGSMQQKDALNRSQDYVLPYTWEVMISCFMNYVCSGDKKERILPKEKTVRYALCKEIIGEKEMIVGAFDSSGIKSFSCRADENYKEIGICPVRRYITLHSEFIDHLDRGFHADTRTESIAYETLRTLNKAIFWDSLEKKGPKKLIVVYRDRVVTYEKAILRNLLKTKPDLVGLKKKLS